MLSLNVLHVAALVALLGALWAIDHTRSENARQADQIDVFERDAKYDRQLIADQSKALASQQALQLEVAAISATTRKMQQAIDAQSSRFRNDFEELKRNDKESRDYLLGLVPAAIGMQYERPETTDPIAYRQAGGVRVGAVPAISTPGPGHE